ncbi:hypothetical protein EU528_02730 [Candidatus Thorarchaeota archaeon]|nr:MAG: hypothetical protein EU528_02730 [Candidatus Thorarchaeota archaeon]
MSWSKNNNEPKKRKPKTPQGISAMSKDLYLGFKFAVNHFLSYFLAMLGIVILTVIMVIVVLLFIVVPLILFVGLPAIIAWVTSFSIEVGTLEGTMLIAIVLMIVMPILGPFFIAYGSLYGMSREIIESESTSAESAFSWYRKRGLSLAGGGIIHFIVSLAPFLIAIYAIFATPIPVPTNESLRLILPVGFIWVILSNGMLSLTFPGIIDGLSAAGAAKRSVRLCCRSPGRVLGSWSVFVVLIGVPIMSFIDDPLFDWISFIPDGFLEPYTLVIALLILFLVLPAMSITFSRIYLILTAQDESVYDNDDDNNEDYTIKLEVDYDES